MANGLRAAFGSLVATSRPCLSLAAAQRSLRPATNLSKQGAATPRMLHSPLREQAFSLQRPIDGLLSLRKEGALEAKLVAGSVILVSNGKVLLQDNRPRWFSYDELRSAGIPVEEPLLLVR